MVSLLALLSISRSANGYVTIIELSAEFDLAEQELSEYLVDLFDLALLSTGWKMTSL